MNGPDGATPEQAFAILQGWIGGKQKGEAPSMASGLVRSFSRGVPLPGMVAQGAASGAGIGALDIAARGGDPSEGALYGGAAGAAGPVVSKVAGEVVAPLARVVRGLRDPLAEAGRRVTGALDRDISGGNAGLSAQEFSAARRAGQPVALMDAGGETTRALMRSQANTTVAGRRGAPSSGSRAINSRARALALKIG